MNNNLILEMKKHPWNSVLQLGIGGLMIFLIALIAGPYYGCGGGNFNLAKGVFSCVDGSTTAASKVLILFCIAASSLCWGRAMSLYEQGGGGPVGNK